MVCNKFCKKTGKRAWRKTRKELATKQAGKLAMNYARWHEVNVPRNYTKKSKDLRKRAGMKKGKKLDKSAHRKGTRQECMQEI